MDIRVIERRAYWLIVDPRCAEVDGQARQWRADQIRPCLRVPRDGRWSWNGQAEMPTFDPSVNESWQLPSHPALGADAGRVERNHYIVTNGMIQFCADSTHHLAGQNVPLPAFTPAEVTYYTGLPEQTKGER